MTVTRPFSSSHNYHRLSYQNRQGEILPLKGVYKKGKANDYIIINSVQQLPLLQIQQDPLKVVPGI